MRNGLPPWISRTSATSARARAISTLSKRDLNGSGAGGAGRRPGALRLGRRVALDVVEARRVPLGPGAEDAEAAVGLQHHGVDLLDPSHPLGAHCRPHLLLGDPLAPHD